MSVLLQISIIIIIIGCLIAGLILIGRNVSRTYMVLGWLAWMLGYSYILGMIVI